MSFGFSPGDIILIVKLAHKTIQGCRKARGEYDELSYELLSLHAVLQRLDQEVKKPESAMNRADESSKEEIRHILEGCGKVLKSLESIFEKYNASSEVERSGRKMWQKIRFGNGELVDIADLRSKVTFYTSALSLLLNIVSMGTMGRIERRMEEAGGDLKEIRQAAHWIAAYVMSKDGSEGSVLTAYADDDRSIWKEFRRELIKDGFSSSLLRKHKATIKAYVAELGDKGILDEHAIEDIEQQESCCSMGVVQPGFDFKSTAELGIIPDSTASEVEESSVTSPFQPAKSLSTSEGNEHPATIAQIQPSRSGQKSLSDISTGRARFLVDVGGTITLLDQPKKEKASGNTNELTQRLEQIKRTVHIKHRRKCQHFAFHSPTTPKFHETTHRAISESILATIIELDSLQIETDEILGMHRKQLITEAKELLSKLDSSLGQYMISEARGLLSTLENFLGDSSATHELWHRHHGVYAPQCISWLRTVQCRDHEERGRIYTPQNLETMWRDLNFLMTGISQTPSIERRVFTLCKDIEQLLIAIVLVVHEEWTWEDYRNPERSSRQIKSEVPRVIVRPQERHHTLIALDGLRCPFCHPASLTLSEQDESRRRTKATTKYNLPGLTSRKFASAESSPLDSRPEATIPRPPSMSPDYDREHRATPDKRMPKINYRRPAQELKPGNRSSDPWSPRPSQVPSDQIPHRSPYSSPTSSMENEQATSDTTSSQNSDSDPATTSDPFPRRARPSQKNNSCNSFRKEDDSEPEPIEIPFRTPRLRRKDKEYTIHDQGDKFVVLKPGEKYPSTTADPIPHRKTKNLDSFWEECKSEPEATENPFPVPQPRRKENTYTIHNQGDRFIVS